MSVLDGWQAIRDAFNSPGVVYLVGDRAGLVKIGYTSDLPRRLSQLQTGHPHWLDVLAFLPGTRDDEGRFHAVFANLRVRGEWFDDQSGYIWRFFRQRAANLVPHLRANALAQLGYADAFEKSHRDPLPWRTVMQPPTSCFDLDRAYHVENGFETITRPTSAMSRAEFMDVIHHLEGELKPKQDRIDRLKAAAFSTSEIWDRHPNWTWGQVEDAYATTHAVAAE